MTEDLTENKINEALFNIWCNDLAKKLLSKNIISVDEFTTTISVFIKSDMNTFISCLVSDLEKEIIILKKKAQIAHKNDASEYYIIGQKIGLLNDRLKQLNIYNAKIRKESNFNKLKNFLRDNGHSDLVDEFYDQVKRRIKSNT